jgi:hypothetical protein
MLVVHRGTTPQEDPFTMAVTSWLLSNILGIILVMVLAIFLYGILAEIFYEALPPGSDPRLATMGPCVVAGLIASITGGFLTARMRVWLETE